MTLSINQINAAAGADTFQIWVDQTNKAINAISTIVVTANTAANGSLTTGNGFVEGVFGSRTLVANTFRGGTVQTSALLTISSNVVFTANTVTMGVVAINTTGISVNGQLLSTGGYKFAIDTVGLAAQEIDNFDKLLFRGADYILTTKSLTVNAFQINKVLMVHDSGNAYLAEYAVTFSNTTQAEFSANANGTHIRLFVTPTSANAHVSGSRITVDI